jgi:hypothetical protein
MMKTFYSLLLIALLFPFLTKAQSNYKPGYVVDLKGDTLKGLINYKEWDQNPKQISFKGNSGAVQVYTPQNAKAFAVDGFEYYEKNIVNASQDPLDLAKLTGVIDTTTRIDTVFLHIMVKGHYLSLYSYRDNIKTHYYILENGNVQPEELGYHAYIDKMETSSVKYVNRYRIQLQYEAQKYGSGDALESLISHTDYTDQGLTKVVSKINGSATSEHINQSRSGTRLFAGVSAYYSSFKFSGAFPFALVPAVKNTSPKIDAGIDFFPFKSVQRFYFRVEVGFMYNQYHFDYNNPGSIPAGDNTTLSVRQYDALITPQLVYNLYNQAGFKVFIDIGFAVNLSSYNNSQLITTYDNFAPNIQSGYPQFYKTWYSFPLKGGIAIAKRLEAYVSYIPSSTITAGGHTDFSGVVTSYTAGINYFFDK